MFSENLKAARKKTGLSQKKLADMLGVNTGTVGNWESGIREPGFQMIHKIANVLNANVASLIAIDTVDMENDASKNAPYTVNINDEDFKIFISLPVEARKQALDYMKYLADKSTFAK